MSRKSRGYIFYKKTLPVKYNAIEKENFFIYDSVINVFKWMD